MSLPPSTVVKEWRDIVSAAQLCMSAREPAEAGTLALGQLYGCRAVRVYAVEL
jgi:hypothetical protein